MDLIVKKDKDGKKLLVRSDGKYCFLDIKSRYSSLLDRLPVGTVIPKMHYQTIVDKPKHAIVKFIKVGVPKGYSRVKPTNSTLVEVGSSLTEEGVIEIYKSY